jgi:hypothetical protein
MLLCPDGSTRPFEAKYADNELMMVMECSVSAEASERGRQHARDAAVRQIESDYIAAALKGDLGTIDWMWAKVVTFHLRDLLGLPPYVLALALLLGLNFVGVIVRRWFR